MRHFRSILYALVLAPAVWVLAGVGLTHDLATRGRDDFAVEFVTGLLLLVLAGAAYAILVLAPISPAGPTVAGLAYLGVAIWALQEPSAYAGIWPSAVAKEGFDLSRPGYGLAALLAVPLIGTALSARRWKRYEPPVLPIIGQIGRARGSAAVAGMPIEAARTALLPGRTTDPDPTTVLRLPTPNGTSTLVASSAADTTVIHTVDDDATVASFTADTAVIRPDADDATVAFDDDPTIVVDEAETATVVSGDDVTSGFETASTPGTASPSDPAAASGSTPGSGLDAGIDLALDDPTENVAPLPDSSDEEPTEVVADTADTAVISEAPETGDKANGSDEQVTAEVSGSSAMQAGPGAALSKPEAIMGEPAAPEADAETVEAKLSRPEAELAAEDAAHTEPVSAEAEVSAAERETSAGEHGAPTDEPAVLDGAEASADKAGAPPDKAGGHVGEADAPASEAEGSASEAEALAGDTEAPGGATAASASKAQALAGDAEASGGATGASASEADTAAGEARALAGGSGSAAGASDSDPERTPNRASTPNSETGALRSQQLDSAPTADAARAPASELEPSPRPAPDAATSDGAGAEGSENEEPTASVVTEAAGGPQRTPADVETIRSLGAPDPDTTRPIPFPRPVPAAERFGAGEEPTRALRAVDSDRTRDLGNHTSDVESTQVIRLPVGDQAERTQVIRLPRSTEPSVYRPGEQTRIIPFPGTGDVGGDETQVIRLPVRSNEPESTQVIRPSLVEPPADRTEVIRLPVRRPAEANGPERPEERPKAKGQPRADAEQTDPRQPWTYTEQTHPPQPSTDAEHTDPPQPWTDAEQTDPRQPRATALRAAETRHETEVRQGSEAPQDAGRSDEPARPPSIAEAEAPNITDDPTGRLVPPPPRTDEDSKRSMTVMNMERPPDD